MVTDLMLATYLAVTPVQAVCSTWAEVVNALKVTHNETLTYRAMFVQGSVMAIFTSPSGEFTVVQALPDGRACMIAVGHGFEEVNEQPNKTTH